MKKLFFLMLLAFNFTFAQDKVSTSREDYDYITKEMPKQLALGNGIKENFELTKIETNLFKDFKYTYYLFVEKEPKKTKALIIIVGKNGKDQVLCLPFNNPELFEEFLKERQKLGISMSMYLDVSAYNVLSKCLEKLSNR